WQRAVEHDAARNDVEQPTGLEGYRSARRPGFLDVDFIGRACDDVPVIAARIETELRIAQEGRQVLQLVADFRKQGGRRGGRGADWRVGGIAAKASPGDEETGNSRRELGAGAPTPRAITAAATPTTRGIRPPVGTVLPRHIERNSRVQLARHGTRRFARR